MLALIPDVKGPKLFAFREDLQNLIFVRLLSSEDDDSASQTPHSRVFEVKLSAERNAKHYALKVVSY